MTMSRFFIAGVYLLTVMLLFAFTSCVNPANANFGKSSEAVLTLLKVADVNVTVPSLINASDWEGYDDLSFLADRQIGEAVIAASAFNEDVTIITERSPKASITFGSGRNLKQPADDKFIDDTIDKISPVELYNGGYLYIRVTAEDGVNINYYCVRTSSVSSNTTLSSLQIADLSVSAGTGNSAAAWDNIPDLREISFTGGNITGKEIKLIPSAAFRGTMEIAKVSSRGTPVFTTYNESVKFNFEDGDEIYVKMIAQDATVFYYGFKISIGKDAGVREINAGGVEVEDYGTPGTTLASAKEGHLLMVAVQPASGFVVDVIPNDPTATVIIGKADEAETNWKTPPQTIKFTDEEFLAVKVVTGDGSVTNYYKIRVDLLATMSIPYGTPSLTDPGNAANAKYVDPIWNDIEWIEVKKQNRAETDQEFFNNPSSTGNAKLYWDEDGLWLYVDVVSEYMTTSGFSNDHLDSSVELFINEAYPAVNSGNYNDIGGQYRLGTNGNTSGDPAAAVAALNSLGRKNAFKTDKGWAVIFQAPWRFSSTYKLEDQKTISLEVQINAVGANGRRIGVLKWYNTTANTYQRAENLAPGVLKLNGNKLKAVPPNISKHPAGQKLMKGDSINELSVTAESLDGGGLSYQWYSNTTDSYTGGTQITGANSSMYQPAVTAVGKYYYWVEVTNMVTGSVKSVNSDRAIINIRDPDSAASDFILNFSPYLKNTTPISNRYQSVHVIDLGENFEVDFFDYISIDMHFYDKDNNEIPSGANSQATLKWWNANRAAVASGTDTYNLGSSSFPLDKASIPAAVKNATAALRYLDIDSADQSQPSIVDAERVVYIEIRNVTFHTPD